MKNTKHQARLEKLAEVTKTLSTMSKAIIKGHPLPLKQQVSLLLSIHEVQVELNELRLWSNVS